MRPRGEIRQALCTAARDLFIERGPFSHVVLAERAQVGYEVARWTARDMATAGELVRVGKEKPAGSRVWRTLYEPAEPPAGAEAADDLSQVVRGWAEFV